MSRWTHDPDGAADELVRRSLDDLALGHRVLAANQGGEVPALLAARGHAVSLWNRRLAAGRAATPWPASGPFDAALLRLPKAKDEVEMAVHAVLGALAPAGRLILYGGNDEGIRSAAAMLGALCGSIGTLAVRGHGRVVAAGAAGAAALRTPLSAWRTVVPLTIGGIARDWVAYPGIFAAGRLDEGTALLIGALPRLAAGARVLDYGCGSGLIAAAALAAEPGLAVDLLDNDAVAIEGARENVPAGRLILGERLADAGAMPYAAILSNPPLHRGIAEDHGLLEQLIADAPAHLAPGGTLQIVVQRRIPLDRLFATHFGSASVVAENGRYRVWRAAKA
ncbi:MAG: class I SAM-dependent methyltransferase [Hyphomicrobiaceae bacterium]|nr:MAG: class I SAM-dependent methyltransferase [Hyphomicrobiaceae bacterium]